MTTPQIIILVVLLISVTVTLILCKIYAKPGTKLYDNIQKLNALNAQWMRIKQPTLF